MLQSHFYDSGSSFRKKENCWEKKICTNLDNLDWGGGGGGGSLGLIGLLTAVAIFSLKDCEIPRRPNLVELAEELKASLIDGLEFIRMRVVSLNKCELLTSTERKHLGLG